MNRQKTTKKGESLARLAEIADVVSRQRVCIHTVLHQNPAFNSMRKRSSNSDEESSASMKKRKFRKNGDEDNGGNGKAIQFRQYQAEIWSDKFEDLLEFRKIFGHCHVPHYYQQNVPLAQWVKRQRYQYKLKDNGKRSTLSDERIQSLNKIEFIWNSHDAVWEERWNELLLFKQMYGDCIVPSTYNDNPRLAVWVKRQRRQYKLYNEGKATSMTNERIAKLEKLEFAWDCRKKDDGCPNKTSESSSEEVQDYEVSAVASPCDQSVGIPAGFPVVYPKCEFFSFSRKFS